MSRDFIDAREGRSTRVEADVQLVGRNLVGATFVAEYDFAVDGGAAGAITLTDADDSAITIPANHIITRAYVEGITTATSGGSATIMLGTAEDTNAFVAATAYGGGVFDADAVTELTAAVPSKVAADSAVVATIATAALTAGKFRVHIECVEGAS